MSTEESWHLQVSFKTPSGTLVNVRGNTSEEIQALLIGVGELAVEVIGIEQKYGAVHNVAPLSTGSSTPPPIVQQSSPVVSAPVSATPTGPTCLHGARTYRSGTSKTNGKPWAAWYCPTPKGTPNQCEVVWA